MNHRARSHIKSIERYKFLAKSLSSAESDVINALNTTSTIGFPYLFKKMWLVNFVN